MRTEPFEEGTIVEECPRCMGACSEEDLFGNMILCTKCNGWGLVEHECVDVE